MTHAITHTYLSHKLDKQLNTNIGSHKLDTHDLETQYDIQLDTQNW